MCTLLYACLFNNKVDFNNAIIFLQPSVVLSFETIFNMATCSSFDMNILITAHSVFFIPI